MSTAKILADSGDWNRTQLDYATMSIRLGLMGCGEHSEFGHAIPLARYAATYPETIVLAAACDLRAERAEMFCQKYGFARAYQIGIKLLQANMPCVLEKPLGVSVADVRQLLEAAKKTRTTNMVSVNRRFMPFLNRGMKWAEAAGKVHYVYCAMLRHARREPEFLRFTAIHALDTMRFIGGEIRASEIRSVGLAPSRWYDIHLQFENGVQGRIDVLPTAGMAEERYELFGHDFRVVITSPFGPQRSLRCYRETRLMVEETAGNETPEDVIQGFYGEVSELVQALSNGRRPKPSIEDIFPSIELCFQLADRAEKKNA
ncbi:MAG: hypothetical protein AUG89_00720 [Acidobacteria bacterium 13_1_20CM_4_56_7]|nr:MAG: hypothetical protein AUG89_00720 [Acidobacteria bacterium 13_1_20CM_4_56_7]